jgi:hypothetical protein
MKTMEEIRKETADRTREVAATARKAAYACVGAPVIAGRKIAETTNRITGTARKDFEAWVEEGERVTSRLRERPVVEELKEKVDLTQLQDRVGRLRDQLEDVLAQWRENFRPHEEAGTEESAAASDEPEVQVEVTEPADG